MNKDEADKFLRLTTLDGVKHKTPTWSEFYKLHGVEFVEYDSFPVGDFVEVKEPIDTSWMRTENWDLGRLAV